MFTVFEDRPTTYKIARENFRIIIDMACHLRHLRKLFLGSFLNSKSSNNYMSL